MKKLKNILFSVLMALASGAAALPPDDVVFKAMQDELGRTMRKLRMEELQKPYFAAYSVRKGVRNSITCSFGGAVEVSTFAYSQALAEVRVGGPSFDNMNFAGRDFWNYGPQVKTSAVDDDYPGQYLGARFALWGATDQAYKQALERFSQKKAYKETKMITEHVDDLSAAAPGEHMEEKEPESMDVPLWKDKISALSSVFRKYAGIQQSSVSLDFTPTVRRFLNSEGTAFRTYSSWISLNLSAQSQAKDGMKVSDTREIYFKSFGDMPPVDKLEDEVNGFASDMTALVNSSTMEAYVGPVIFEDQAAAEFFNQLLIHNVSFPRSVWVENEADKDNFESGAFADKLGMRVVSPFFNVTDDPLLEKYNGTALLGNYAVDNEGVPARKVELVKKGRLTDLYMSRTPTREREISNGHGRGSFYEFPTGRPGNVLVQPDKTISKTELKKKLIDMCRELELDYGMLIRRMSPEQSREENALLSPPVLAYKVYVKDGREEAVHGIDFAGVSFRALRDIVAASGEMYVYNYYQLGPLRQNRGVVPASITVPSVLLQEMEIKKSEKKPEKLPYLKHPYFADRR